MSNEETGLKHSQYAKIFYKPIKRIVQVGASSDRDWRLLVLVRLYRWRRKGVGSAPGPHRRPEWGAGHPGLRTLHLILDSLLIIFISNILVRSKTLGCASLF